MLGMLNKEEETKAIKILIEKRIDFSVKHYVLPWFGMECEVCDITINTETKEAEEVVQEITHILFPWFD